MRRSTLKRWLRLPASRASIAREVRAELINHLEETVEHLVRRGMSPDDARAEALSRLGSLEAAERQLIPFAEHREETMKTREWLTSFLDDIRYTLRSLRARPAFATLVMTTLALGIGANVAMFSLVDRVLVQGPAHLVDADRLRRFYLTATPPAMARLTFSYTALPVAEMLRRDSSAFSAVAAYSASQVTFGRGENAERLEVTNCTGSFFRTLGARPLVGRFFDDQDVDLKAEPTVAVISQALWQRQFGAARDVIGQPIVLDERQYRIIGIAPLDFTGPEFKRVDVWLPFGVRSGPYPGWATSWSATTFQVFVRLHDGVSAATAEKRATVAHGASYDGLSTWKRAGRVELLPLRFTSNGAEPMEFSVSRWLYGVAVIVLLTAFANVANMLLARGVSRQREIAVRLALGIQRWRLTRLLLAESVLLAIGGGVVGLLVGVWGGGLIRATLFPAMPDLRLRVDPRLGLFAAAATALTALALGITASVQAAPANVTASLKEGVQRGGVARRRLGAALTVAQAALSMVLLVGSGLFLLSVARVRRVDLGMRTDRVVFASVRWRRDASASQRQLLIRESIDALRRNPAVRYASIAPALPFRSTGINTIRVAGRDSIPELPGGGPFINAVGIGYFETLGSQIIAGRGFAVGDASVRPRPIVISETTAHLLWPDVPALGKCIFIGTETSCSPVIGVMKDARRFALFEAAAIQVFTLFDEQTATDGYLLAQVQSSGMAAVESALRKQLAHAGPVAYVDVGSVQDAIDVKVRPWTLGASMFSIFGGLTLVIAVVGLYSIVSYATAHRTHEIGVRIALGARVADIIRMVIASGLSAVAVGIALGGAIALAAGRRLQPLLFDTSARDPRVFLAVMLVLLVCGVAACVIPGRRASRVNPIIALRAD